MENIQDPSRRIPDPSEKPAGNTNVPPPVPPVNPISNPAVSGAQPYQQPVNQPYQQPYQQQPGQVYQQPVSQPYQQSYQQNPQTHYNQAYRQNQKPELYPPVKMGEWMLTLFVMAIPIVGFIMLLVWAFSSSTNPSKSGFAKAALLWGIIIGIIYVIIYVIIFVLAGVSTGFLNL